MSAPRNPKVELACADYEVLKLEAMSKPLGQHKITVAMVEKRHGLKRGQLYNYRTNHGLSINAVETPRQRRFISREELGGRFERGILI